jgi:hypothetical protein
MSYTPLMTTNEHYLKSNPLDEWGPFSDEDPPKSVTRVQYIWRTVSGWEREVNALTLSLHFPCSTSKRPKLPPCVISALESAWRSIQEQWKKLPDVVIVIGPVSRMASSRSSATTPGCDGSPAASAAQKCSSPPKGSTVAPRAVFETLLHEAVHAYQDVIGEAGTSRQGRYHNKTFRKRADSFGLVVKAHPQIGCVTPDITDACAYHYRDAIAEIDEALKVARACEPETPNGSETGVVLICGCERRSASRDSTAEEGPIVCGRCAEEFLPEGSKGAKGVSMPGDDDLAEFLRRALGGV